MGYWQLSRIHALIGQVDQAREYGQLCLMYSQKEGTLPFHLAFAYEALARAEALAGEASKAKDYLEKARQAGDKITDRETLQNLLADLATIK